MKKIIAIACIVILGLSSSSQTCFDIKDLDVKKKVTIIRVRNEVGTIILQAEV